MTTENLAPALDEEKKPLRKWLEENDPPPNLVSDICPMRSLVALGATIMGLDPGEAGRHLMSRTELTEMMIAAKRKHEQILEQEGCKEHVAPIIPAEGLMVAMIIKRPTSGMINEINGAVLDGAMGADGARGLKISMLTQMLAKCAVFPDVKARQAIFIAYGGLQLEFANKCMALGHRAVEDIVGK